MILKSRRCELDAFRKGEMMRLIGIVGLVLVLMIGVSPIAAQEYGTGWSEAYWNGSDFISFPLISRTLSGGIDFDWGVGSPEFGIIDIDNWVARYASAQVFTQGTYEFVISTDGGVRFLIDNVVVFDQFSNDAEATYTFEQMLSAGTHQLRLEYRHIEGYARLEFYWIRRIPPPFLITNGSFSQPIGSSYRNWGVFSSPTPDDMVYRVQNGVFEFYRASSTGNNSAVLIQNTDTAIFSTTRLEVMLYLGNTSNIRKRTTILIHDGDFSDFFACSFWLPPNTSLQAYRMIGVARENWMAAHISIYASNADGVGWTQVDGVSMSTQQSLESDYTRTLCYDPETPPPE